MRVATQSTDEIVASVLAFLASEPERLARFFILTGLRADTIRAASRTPGFAASVLDYVLADERLLLAFAAGAEIKPEELAQLRWNLNHAPEPQGDRGQTHAPVGSSNMARRFGTTPRYVGSDQGNGEALQSPSRLSDAPSPTSKGSCA